MKWVRDRNPIIEEYNIPLSTMARSTRQKVNKETLDMNYTIDQMDLSYTFYPVAAEYTLFSDTQVTFSRKDCMLGYKTNFSHLKNGWNHIRCLFWPNYFWWNYKWVTGGNWKIHKCMEIKYAPEQTVAQRWIKNRNKKYLETNENAHTTFQNLCASGKGVLRGKFLVINACLKKKERSQINNLTLHIKKPVKKKKKKLSPNVAEERQ